jgi:hypothetical protein
MGPKPKPAIERFMQKVQIDESTGCWRWIGATNRRDGYGVFWVNRDGVKNQYAHIFSYEHKYGPVPDGLVLDHVVCDTPACVNPDHVTPKTQQQNFLRSNHPNAVIHRTGICKHGHVLADVGTYPRSDGRQGCAECMRIWKANYRVKNRDRIAAYKRNRYQQSKRVS